MSYNFRAFLAGRWFDQDDFLGMAYQQGVPDAVEAMADHVLGSTATQGTPAAPAVVGTPLVVNLASTLVVYATNSAVILFKSSPSVEYVVGEVVSQVGAVLTIVPRVVVGTVNAFDTNMTVAPAEGPVGWSGDWAGTRPRLIDEGGWQGSAGIPRYYSASQGLLQEGGITHRHHPIPTTPAPRDFWRMSADREGRGLILNGGIRFDHSLSPGSSPWIRLRHVSPILPSECSMILLRAYPGTLQGVHEWFIGLSNDSNTERVGIRFSRDADGLLSYSLIHTRSGPSPVNWSMGIDEDSLVKIQFGIDSLNGSGTVWADMLTVIDATRPADSSFQWGDGTDPVARLLVEAKAPYANPGQSTIFFPFYSISRPLPLR